ncbi:hypothetical protein BJ165DRAFT_1528164 [Panaeolus papilionaceus]|nr:hypothetical protein BJ165DRAFT_1528164 [Panaeolus papilionaceus]
MEEVEFGPSHPIHRRVAWANNQWVDGYPITFPKAFIKYLACNDNITPEIQRLDYIEDRLEEKKKKAFACGVILSPFRCLPQDILHQIALHCAPDEHVPGEWRYRYETSPAWHVPCILAATSRSWRETVHSISSLWCFIGIDCTVRNPRNMTVFASRMERFSRLSKFLPLSIHIDESYPPDIDEDEEEDIMIYSQLEHVLGWLFHSWTKTDLNRMRKLSVRAHKVEELLSTLYTFSRSESDRLPNVETFLIREMAVQREMYFWTYIGDFLTIFDMFPNLRHFSMGEQPYITTLKPGIFTQMTPTRTHPSMFVNLTTIHMGLQITFQDWHSLLMACPNLKFACFEVTALTPDDDIPGPDMVVHNELCELVITYQDVFGCHILEPFIGARFPSLRWLRLNVLDDQLEQVGHDSYAPYHPRRFLDTFPSLRTLVIGDSTTRIDSYSYLYPLFLCVPTVTTLFIYANRAAQLKSIMDFVIMRTAPGSQDALSDLRRLNVTLSFVDGGEIDELEKSFTMNRDHKHRLRSELNQSGPLAPAIRFGIVADSVSRSTHKFECDGESKDCLRTRLKTLDELVVGHGMDIQFRMDQISEDSNGLLQEGPFDTPIEEWIIRRF